MSYPKLKCPPHVAWLGYGGLLPFIGLAIFLVIDPRRAGVWSHALVGYGAVILSVVGALHWGVAMSANRLDPAQRRGVFVWSIVPALIAWSALVVEGRVAALILVSGFVCHLIRDIRLARAAQLPAWYLPLRWRLTVVASFCLLVKVVLG